MSCHGNFTVEEETRRRWHSPEAVLKDIGLREGMTFVDVGCGDGFFTVPAAQIVGERGKVYAVDIDGSAIERLKRKAAEKSLTNITTEVGEAEATVFCEACADIVFYSIVLHDFKDPSLVLLNAKRMLKTSGLLVDLDWKKKQTEFGPPVQIRFNEAQAVKLIKVAGFSIDSVKDVGADHYLITAKPVMDAT